MHTSAKREIFDNLRFHNSTETLDRPPKIDQVCFPTNRISLIRKFIKESAAASGIPIRVHNLSDLKRKLTKLFNAEDIRNVMISIDDSVNSNEFIRLGLENRINVFTPNDFRERDEYHNTMFDKIDASITIADFAVAESGALVIKHHRNQTRLNSLAPAIHIALVHVSRIVAYYEDCILSIFENKDNLPSQVTMINGPSKTADIAASPMVGMHGSKKLVIFLIDEA